jgi:pimeloyl-ACP methyl ester carboxylesterase
MNRIRANGLEFAYLEEGDGPLVLLLHGFPDSARSWSHQMRALAAADYRVVAPYLRGYPPSEIPRDGFYDKGTLVADIAALIRALGGGAPAHIVGQDWGASITYNLLAALPELVRRAVVLAVPHPAQTAKSVLNARHVHRSFHWWFFQLPNLPERALAENDFAFIDYLWEYWTSPLHRLPLGVLDVTPSSITSGSTGRHPATGMRSTSPTSSACSENPMSSPRHLATTAHSSTHARWTRAWKTCGNRWTDRSQSRRSRCVAVMMSGPSS